MSRLEKIASLVPRDARSVADIKVEVRMPISQQVSTIIRAFADGIKRILREKLHGAYVYGAAAFPDDQIDWKPAWGSLANRVGSGTFYRADSE